MVIPGKYAINYYICAGLNPNIDPYDEEKVVMFILVEVLLWISNVFESYVVLVQLNHQQKTLYTEKHSLNIILWEENAYQHL